jgi:hypothetical protein
VINEVELAAADALGGMVAEGAPVHPSHTHSRCLNCGAQLRGRYCHVCGQSADDHHRSILHLAWEAVEGFTHLDGRLAKTLPALLLRPGRLARDHIEGRRARHVPPFRLFLIALLIFMLAMENAVQHRSGTAVTLSTDNGSKVAVQARPLTSADLDKGVAQIDLGTGRYKPLETWLKARIPRAVHNPEFFEMVVFEWAHRLAVLMLPILAGLLTLLYILKREFYVYDHLIVAMQYLAFCFLIWAIVWSAPSPVRGLLFLAALIWTPVNLFMTLRGAYGSSRLSSAVKALFLWTATVSIFSLLLTGLLVLALVKIGPG